MADVTFPKVKESNLPEASMVNVTHLRVVSTDNSQRLPIGGLTIQGDKVAVSATEIDATTLDQALDELALEIASKADTSQVEALDAAVVRKTAVSQDIITDASSTTKVPSVVGIIAPINNTYPAVSHYKRVLADSGLVPDRSAMLLAYAQYLLQLTETERLFIPECGIKERTSGVNRFSSKIYDLKSALDAAQATEGDQPYIGGFIAPNERRCIKYVAGQTQTGLLDFTDKAYAAGDSWTARFVIEINAKGSAKRLYLGAGYISFTDTTIVLHNGTDAVLTGTGNVECGKTHVIEFQYSNGAGLVKLNNNPLVTVAASKAMTFGQLSNNTTYPFDGSIYAFHLLTGRESEADSQANNVFLRTMFPDIESVTIGNQVWSTSNFEGIVAGDGTVVPEVQDPLVAANATNIYNTTYAATAGSAAVKDLAATKAAAMWCHYDNLATNGAVYGKLYNLYAVHLFDLYPPVKGWRIPSKADFGQLVANQGGSTVAGRKIKAKFGWFNNANASNESGFSFPAGQFRLPTGTFYTAVVSAHIFTSDYIRYFVLDYDTAFTSAGVQDKATFASLRLLRNEPAGQNELSYTSGLFTTDITSAAKQIPISFGRTVDYIRIKSENSLTAIEAKLHNAAGTAVATLITGKTIGAGETKMFAVTADWVSLLQDGTIRVTAAGNSGSAVGMEIEVLTHKGVLS